MERFTEVMMEILLIVVVAIAAMWGFGVVFHSEGLLKAGTAVCLLGLSGVFGTVALVYAAMIFGLPIVAGVCSVLHKT